MMSFSPVQFSGTLIVKGCTQPNPRAELAKFVRDTLPEQIRVTYTLGKDNIPRINIWDEKAREFCNFEVQYNQQSPGNRVQSLEEQVLSAYLKLQERIHKKKEAANRDGELLDVTT